MGIGSQIFNQHYLDPQNKKISKQKRKIQGNLFSEHRKYSTKHWEAVQQSIKESTHPDQVSFIPRMCQYMKIIINNTLHKQKRENYIVSLIDSEKAFEEIQFKILIKTLRKIVIEGYHLNLVKIIYN